MNTTAIHLVVALPAEAKPLIKHFGLKREQPDGEFPIYTNQEITLVRSGVGQNAAAAATRFLFARQGQGTDAVWLNIGIAGHAARAIGEAVLANRIIEAESQRSWQPRIDFNPPCPTESLITLPAPLLSYEYPGAADMEAAGFMFALQDLQPGVHAHSLKIISDNRDNPAQGISSRLVGQLISMQLDTITQLLKTLTHQLRPPNLAGRHENPTI